MSSARIFTAFGIVGLVAACTNGGSGGGSIAFNKPQPRESPGSSSGPESPGSTRDPAPSGYEPAPGGPESPSGDDDSTSSSSSSGSSSSGSSGGGACPSCNQTYSCSVAGQGSTLVQLSQGSNGQCTATIEGDPDAGASTFSCSNGTISTDGTTISWTSDGAGGFTYSVDGVTVTCDPAAQGTPVTAG